MYLTTLRYIQCTLPSNSPSKCSASLHTHASINLLLEQGTSSSRRSPTSDLAPVIPVL